MNVVLYRNLDAATLGALRAEFPACDFRQTTAPAELEAWLDWAEALYGNAPPALLLRAPRLRWVQIVSSGFDEYTALAGSPVAVTTAHGVHAPIIAQHTLLTILYFARAMPHLLEKQRAHLWDRNPALPQDLARQTVGLIGYGEIGQAIARLLAPIGTRVIAMKREPAVCPPELAALHTVEAVDTLLGTSDHVVVALPLTPHTRGFFDAARLTKMKRGAFIHNVARGGIVDESALLAKLADGSLGGAALDVFAHEPLPVESPLWSQPNVLVTPHLAGHHQDLGLPTFERFRTNLRRQLAGLPMEHLANFKRGY
jgi:phosphoglycerate dehydrogenase-like enzyme